MPSLMDSQEKAEYLAEIVRQIVAPNPMLHVFGRNETEKTEVVSAAVRMLGNAAYLETPVVSTRPEDFPVEILKQAVAENDILVLDEPNYYLGSEKHLEEIRAYCVEQGKLLILITQQEQDARKMGLRADPNSVVMVEMRKQEMRVSMGGEWPASYLRMPFDGSAPRLITNDPELATRAAELVGEKGKS